MHVKHDEGRVYRERLTGIDGVERPGYGMPVVQADHSTTNVVSRMMCVMPHG